MDFLQGVYAQPENLARSRAVLTDALAGTDVSVLRRGVLAVVGMGASHHAAISGVGALRLAGSRAYAASAAELLDDPPTPADAYLAVSYSGRSRETVEGLERLAAHPHLAGSGPLTEPHSRLGLSNDPTAPLSRVTDAVLPLGSLPDTPVSTLSYTATLQAFGLLAEAIGASSGRQVTEGWAALPEVVARTLSGNERAAEQAATRLDGVACLDVVGGGRHVASAGAAALLLREAARLPTASMDTYQYLHGPLETAGPGRGALLFGDGREIALARQLASYGATVVLVTDADVRDDGLLVLPVPKASPIAAAILDILPVQLLAHHLARARGLAITGLRHMPDDTKLRPECDPSR